MLFGSYGALTTSRQAPQVVLLHQISWRWPAPNLRPGEHAATGQGDGTPDNRGGCCVASQKLHGWMKRVSTPAGQDCDRVTLGWVAAPSTPLHLLAP
jgi:hypothetical protein